MPDFLDPIKLIGYFGTWALVGLLVVIFVESGVLFPVLPGDTLLFVAGMLAAGTAAAGQANFQLWQLLVFIPIAAILGGQVGYFIGRYVGTAMFKPNARVLKQRYLDEAHTFFEERGPFAIVIARFVPIVRTLAPITAGAARMSYGVFTLFNVIGAVVWGVGLTLLGYGLGQFEIIQKLLEPIFILIALASVSPMIYEWYKRRRAARKAHRGAGHRSLGGGPLLVGEYGEQLPQTCQRLRRQEEVAVRQRRRHRRGQRPEVALSGAWVEPNQLLRPATHPDQRPFEHIGRIAVPPVGRDDHHRATQRVAVGCRNEFPDAAPEMRTAVAVGDLRIGLGQRHLR